MKKKHGYKKSLIQQIYEDDTKIPMLSSLLTWDETCDSEEWDEMIEQLIAIRWKLTNR